MLIIFALLTLSSSMYYGSNYVSLSSNIVTQFCQSNGTACFHEPDHCILESTNGSCTLTIGLTNYAYGLGVINQVWSNSTHLNTTMGVFLFSKFNASYTHSQTLGVALSPAYLSTKNRKARKFDLFECTLDNQQENVTKILQTVGRLDYLKVIINKLHHHTQTFDSIVNHSEYFACTFSYSYQDLWNKFHSSSSKEDLIKVILVNVTVDETSEGIMKNKFFFI